MMMIIIIMMMMIIIMMIIIIIIIIIECSKLVQKEYKTKLDCVEKVTNKEFEKITNCISTQQNFSEKMKPVKFSEFLRNKQTTPSRLKLTPNKKITWICYPEDFCPVGYSCRIHRLHLCRGVRPPPTTTKQVSRIWHQTIWWWCCSFVECKVPLHCHCSQVPSGAELEHLTGSQLRVMLNWIAWNKTVFGI